MYQCSYCIFSEITLYTTDSSDLHNTCPTGVADLLFKCHVCVDCDSKYVDIVVLFYSIVAILYGHLVICVVFCREDYEYRLIFINLQRTSAHPVRYICNVVLDAGDRILYSCCSVCTLYIYLGVITITVVVDGVFLMTLVSGATYIVYILTIKTEPYGTPYAWKKMYCL